MSKNLTSYSVYDRTEKFNWIKPLKTFSTFNKAKRFFDSNEEAKLIEKYHVTKSSKVIFRIWWPKNLRERKKKQTLSCLYYCEMIEKLLSRGLLIKTNKKKLKRRR
jgi:hypothetical protein